MRKITKSQLKEIYHKIDNRIVNRINKLGSTDKEVAAKKHPELDEAGSGEYGSLVRAARKYDIEDFFVLSRNKAKRDMRVQYRVLLTSYQGVRDGGVAVIKKIYKLRYDR